MKVTLAKAHEHAGVEYPAGAEIDVTSAEADYLSKQGVTGASSAAATPQFAAPQGGASRVTAVQ